MAAAAGSISGGLQTGTVLENDGTHVVFNGTGNTMTKNIGGTVTQTILNNDAGFHLLILQARHTSALVSFLTSSVGAELLQKLWNQKGSPASYEIAVYSEMIDDHPVKTWPEQEEPA